MTTTFEQLGVAEDLCHALSEQGFKNAFPIQEMTIPDGLAGRSFRAVASGSPPPGWCATLAVESQESRMVRDDRYKYILWDHGANREQLFDLLEDPYETVNRSNEPGLAANRDALRATLREWAEHVGDQRGLDSLHSL